MLGELGEGLDPQRYANRAANMDQNGKRQAGKLEALVDFMRSLSCMFEVMQQFPLAKLNTSVQ